MRNLLLLFLILGVTACSGGKSKKDIGDKEAGIELSDSDDFADDNLDSDDDLVGDSVSESDNSNFVQSGEQKVYTVQKNETLMMVAFKIYGDYAKWKDIAELNGISGQSISEGQSLNYNAPSSEFVWGPEGSPYLIKEKDTLGTISNDTYGTTKYWKNIWENNRPLIKDPNKIYVGFTIYTPNIESRDVANQ